MRKHATRVALFLTALVTVLSIACKKNGTGGKAEIEGQVKHHERLIPAATVYIRYGATEFPGTDVSLYDNNTQASAADGHYRFDDLRAGNYYLYGIGYDSSISKAVSGGIPVTIRWSERKNRMETDVPVTE